MYTSCLYIRVYWMDPNDGSKRDATQVFCWRADTMKKQEVVATCVSPLQTEYVSLPLSLFVHACTYKDTIRGDQGEQKTKGKIPVSSSKTLTIIPYRPFTVVNGGSSNYYVENGVLISRMSRISCGFLYLVPPTQRIQHNLSSYR